MQDPDRRGRRACCAALIQGRRVHEWSWNAPSLFSKHQRQWRCRGRAGPRSACRSRRPRCGRCCQSTPRPSATMGRRRRPRGRAPAATMPDRAPVCMLPLNMPYGCGHILGTGGKSLLLGLGDEHPKREGKVQQPAWRGSRSISRLLQEMQAMRDAVPVASRLRPPRLS